MTIVLATHNPGKRDEMQGILAPMGWEMKTLAEMKIVWAPEETGATFLENARIKARAATTATGLPALADDSGLCVDALDGAPGVFSARFGGNPTDRTRTAHLLRKLEGVADRRAAFVCSVVLAYPDGRELSAEGRLEGQILEVPQGTGGFGYDPVFYLPGEKRTLAEMTRSEKAAHSHRGHALRALMTRWFAL